MNLLIKNAPDYITAGGKKLYIRTDFNLWVRFLIACKNRDDDEIADSITAIVKGEIPRGKEAQAEFAKACFSWLSAGKEQGAQQSQTGQAAFDFEQDGSVIYCEMWEYFPHLMQRGISFHEGIEIIQTLLHNDSTMLWHRAFARCGDFSALSKNEKKYWTKERAKYTIRMKQSQEQIDAVMSGDF